MALEVKLLSDCAKLPIRMTDGSAGYDLFSAEDKVIRPFERCVIRTDIVVMAPTGTYARIAGRSGLALQEGITVAGGVIDCDYRGNVGVILFNLSSETFVVSIGDRIAQMILELIATPEVQEIKRHLETTERNEKGFGSSGKR